MYQDPLSLAKAPNSPGSDPFTLGLSEREIRSYSLLRAIINAKRGSGHSSLEAEASNVIAQRRKINADRRAFYVPADILRRDLTTANTGAYLAGARKPPMNFVESRKAASVVETMGVRVVDMDPGNAILARTITGPTTTWLSTEGTAAGETTPVFGQLSAVPKTVGAYLELSDTFLRQATQEAEDFVIQELAGALAAAQDVAVVAGTGGAQPLGIVNVANVGTASGTSFGWTAATEMINDVSAADAVRQRRSLGFVGAPDVELLLRRRERATGNGGFVWDGDAIGGAYRALASSSVPAGTLVYGDWSSVVVPSWGGLEIAVNEYAGFATGIVGVRALWSLDVMVLYPQSFTVASSIT